MNVTELKNVMRAVESGAVEAYINGKKIQSRLLHHNKWINFEGQNPNFEGFLGEWRVAPEPVYSPLTPEQAVHLLGKIVDSRNNLKVTAIRVDGVEIYGQFVSYTHLMSYECDGKPCANVVE